jgi:hypothetical protein
MASVCLKTKTRLVVAEYIQPQQNPGATATTKDETMINDRDAIVQAQALYREACERFKKRPRETVGEVMFAEGLKVAVLFDANGRLAAAYQVTDDRVADLDGHELVKLRSKFMHRKAR